MSADERPAAKYGMPGSESQRYEAAQDAIAHERAVLKELRFAHALRVGPSLRAALDALSGKPAAPVPVKEVPTPEATAEPVAAQLINLRTALGLQ